MRSDNQDPEPIADILIALLIIMISVSVSSLTWENMLAVPVGLLGGAVISILVSWIHYKIDIRRMRK